MHYTYSVTVFQTTMSKRNKWEGEREKERENDTEAGTERVRVRVKRKHILVTGTMH